jgi:hypothetical protein
MKSSNVLEVQDLWTNPFKMTTTLRSVDAGYDLLAVSAYLFRRYRNDPANRFSDLIQMSKRCPIEGQDRQRAEEIARHFSEQIVLAQLRGDPITDFQQVVAEFVNSNRMTLREGRQGMIYRLPEYYENDIKVRDMFSVHWCDHKFVPADNRGVRTLVPVDTVERNTRHESVIQYWLKDEVTGNPTMLTVDSKNQLKYLWDDQFARSESLSVSAQYQNRTHANGQNFVQGKSWRLEIKS